MVRSSVFGMLVVASLLVHGTAIGIGSPRSRHYWARPATPVNTEPIVEEYVEVPLDHFGENNDTFLNRFWVAESGYQWGGPVFIYDEGETDASSSALDTLQDSTFMFKQLVDRFGGIGIVWEHRFYGSSTPVKIDSSTPAEAFRYLTTEQSLADVKTFANQFHRLNIPDVDLTPLGTPWVFVGSSYSGARAAFMRNIYPETIYASFASSAPVEARIDMSAYWEAVYRGMEANGWGNCTKDIHAAVVYMDKIMGDAGAAADLKIKLLGRGADRQPNTVFADALEIIFDGWQNFGIGESLRSFCDWLETDPITTLTATADGWAATKGVEFVVDRWADWPVWTTMVNSYLMAACGGLVQGNETAADCNPEHRFTDPSDISWAWQYCTQWGFFQSANLGPTQLISAYDSLEHQRDICHRQFPDAEEDLLPHWPRVYETNAYFGGWDIRPSNVYWSVGEFDPWRSLGPLSNETWAPHPISTQQVPACGVSTDVSSIFSYMIPNAEHASDFSSRHFPESDVSKKHFSDALAEWLECWRPPVRL